MDLRYLGQVGCGLRAKAPLLPEVVAHEAGTGPEDARLPILGSRDFEVAHRARPLRQGLGLGLELLRNK